MITTEGLLEAYYDCRKRKRKTASAIMYEINYESKLIELRDRVNNRTYQPGKSICFIVTRPRYREVFAAAFEDRIIHHWIAIRLEPLFEQIFSPRTFNCRKEKGQLYGVNMLVNDIKTCSRNYTRDCYVMKLDLQGFFMSINKAMLAKMVDDFVVETYTDETDKETLRYLCRTVVLHEPEYNCERHSPLGYWDYIPANKSLFTNGRGYGVAIGNLFSQLFANYLLNVLDWFLLEDLGFTYVGRYVDDFYVVDTDKAKMLDAVMAVRRLNRAETLPEVMHAVDSINSYLGCLRHCREYNQRVKLLRRIEPRCYKWIYIKGRYEIVAIKKKFRKRTRTLQRINDGNY